MVEAARIAWTAILNKPRQLIDFNGADVRIFGACTSSSYGTEWTLSLPQKWPYFLRKVWGREQ